MVKKFSQAEKSVLCHFSIGKLVNFQGENFTVVKAGKPTTKGGEPKTDIYLLLENENGYKEIKISYKKSNADFLENKITSERAKQIWGADWQKIIQHCTKQIQDKFLGKSLIFKTRFAHTEQGSITLGWKFELMNKLSGELSDQMQLSYEQCFDVYAGTSLSESKRNATVNSEVILNSGVANYIVVGEQFLSADDVLSQMQTIDDYIKKFPNVYFACKALNYRTYKSKWDGDRPLAVQVGWAVENSKLTPTLIFDRPFLWNGNAVAKQLEYCLAQLNINNTDDIYEHNAEQSCIHK